MTSQALRAPSIDQTNAQNLYADILNESRLRLFSIEHAVSGRSGLLPHFVKEFSYLQLRLLCELIALGCLVAHGDIKATHVKTIQKAYAADKIIDELEKLHPNFYPHAIITKTLPPTESSPSSTLHVDRIEDGFLSKSDLIKLYGKCGDHLHRGNLKNLKTSISNAQPLNYDDILAWTKKISTLLREHHIASQDNLAHFICFLSHVQANGDSIVVLALSPLPTQ